MDTKELRIGNYLIEIDRNKEEKLTEVFGIITNYINPIINKDYNGGAFGQKRYYQGYEYKPIPLTEEWLHDFGFELDNGFTTYKIDVLKGYLIVAVDGSWGLYKDEYSNRIGSSYNNTKEIKYVHELQNFYFALTGEELTLNEI